MTEIIVLKNITKIYQSAKNLKAVDNINFSVNEGEFLCLIGPSGCGKTTILKLVSGLEQPTVGEIKKPENISMVFQSGALLPWLSVEENIALPLKMANLDKEKIKEQVLKYITMVGLEDFKKRYPRELSGGQKQRVGIARALAVEPKVLLLDEPFSALDPVTTMELHNYLLKIWQETQKTIIMVSHLIEEAVLLSDRILVMKIGSIKEIIEVGLKRPRKNNSEEFVQTVEKVRKILE